MAEDLQSTMREKKKSYDPIETKWKILREWKYLKRIFF